MGFHKDTKLHEMTCIKSDGVYRHYHFSSPENSAYWFDIVTTPYYLYMTGDMGTWVFSRIKDMLHFFNKNNIDYGYWAEKLQIASHRTEVSAIYKEVDLKETFKSLNNDLQQWKYDVLEDEEDLEKIADLKEAYKDFSRRIGELKSIVEDYSVSGSISEQVYSFAFEKSGLTDPSVGGIDAPWDYFEVAYPRIKPTHHFAWACEAIQYASKKILVKELADKAIDKFLVIGG
ncbi:hypothetical protein LZ636_11410 [Proteus terrae]|uniref:hypothetical protein n=1 Tax=Proteus terrae TaxID=1574161 RepID=UPI001F2406E1|nr:hypothetical protein [Proteus terrae]MCE9840288.1 hypothetical protein [Proteus terrae]